MKEIIREHGGAVADAAGAILVTALIAGAVFGGGISRVTEYFSAWLYG